MKYCLSRPKLSHHSQESICNKILNLKNFLGFSLVFCIFLFVSFVSSLYPFKWNVGNSINRINLTNKSCIEQDFQILKSEIDKDFDGVDDYSDIYQSAINQTKSHVKYIDKYYSDNNGKPPEDEGVCTDVVWRALRGAGYDFQEMLDTDIRANTDAYPLDSWTGIPDTNIDFRRVPNIEIYLKRHVEELTIDIIPCDKSNLDEWQAGDIVIFSIDGVGPSDHIAIVSQKRDNDGVPYLIHNWGLGTKEDLQYWGDIRGHYRFTFNLFESRN